MRRLLLIADEAADTRRDLRLSSTDGRDLTVRRAEGLDDGLSALREQGADCVLLPSTALEDAEADRRRAERREKRLRGILETVSDGVAVVGSDGRFEFANPAAERMLGASGESIRGRRCRAFLRGCDVRSPLDALPKDGGSVVDHLLRSRASIREVEIGLRDRHGRERVLSLNAAPLTADPDEAAPPVVISARDVTERVRHERQLRHRNLHDDLTGLPNRALFHDRLEQLLRSRDPSDGTVAVLVLDVDRFQVINDCLGHRAGDRLIEQVGVRLREAVRDRDTVARLGSDEFAVLLGPLPREDLVERRASDLLEALEVPMSVGDDEVYVEVSIGIALSDRVRARPGLSPADSLVTAAHEAMHRAKESTGSACRVASPAEIAAPRSRFRLESRLRSALATGAMDTVYQPIVELGSRRVVGVEALARWRDPELGQVSPGRFIPLAEETGLIAELGRQQMRTACRDVADWSGDGGASDLRLHVNLSMAQLDDSDVVDDLREILAESGFSADRLWLEITEGVTTRQPARLARLSGLGCRLSVDDFGTRHSTLAQLKRLDLHGLKIDRSFVDGACDSNEDRAIVESVITLGRRLGLEVVAEGIETEEQLMLLRRGGCDYGQGYLLGRPAPADEIVGRLRAQAEDERPSRPAQDGVAAREDADRTPRLPHS